MVGIAFIEAEENVLLRYKSVLSVAIQIQIKGKDEL
jgi:hypothetical protein